jgi:hypothetical protein
MYYSRIKRYDPLIFGKRKGYAVNVTESKQVPRIEQLVQNQYLVKIPTSGLKQPILVTRNVFVPQAMTFVLLVNIHVTIELLICGNGVPIQQPKRVNP